MTKDTRIDKTIFDISYFFKICKIINFIFSYFYLTQKKILANENFNVFLNNFIENKISKKYKKSIISDLKKNAYFIKRVVELDRNQPEFTLTLNEYISKVVNKSRVNKAIKLYKKNYDLLKKISS